MRLSVTFALVTLLAVASTGLARATAALRSNVVGVGVAPEKQAVVSGVPQQPPRDGRFGTHAAKGTASISGAIVAADTGQPLRRAQVRVMGERGLSGGGVAQTDAQGRFEVTGLVGNRYHVSVSKTGFVSQSYGQRRPNQAGTPIELSEGHRAQRVNIAMTRAGAITGRIVDEFGEPVAGARMTVRRYAYTRGGRQLVGAGAEGGFDQTNDLGEYRLYGLAPGEYYVSAQVRNHILGMPGVSAPLSSDGFAPTYYPGTSSPGSAEPISVKAGAATANVSFAMISTRVGRLSGSVVTSSGEPAVGFRVMVSERNAAGGPSGTSGTVVRSDGTFETQPLPPGTYTVVARQVDPRGSRSNEIARMDVTTSGEGVESLLLSTGPGGIIRGRIVTDDGTLPAFEATEARVFPVVEEMTRASIPMMRPVSVHGDWSFELNGLSDRVRLAWSGGRNAGNWSLKYALKNGVDLADHAIDVYPGQVVENVEIVITQKITEVFGRVLDERGEPATDATVVIFAEDEGRWTTGTRYIRTGRPDTEGKYRIRLTPGLTYLVAVVDIFGDGRYSDPEVLAALAPSAVKLAIAEGESKVLDLRRLQ